MTTQSPENNKSKPEAQSATIETQADTFRSKAIKSRYIALASFVGSFAAGYTSFNALNDEVPKPLGDTLNNPIFAAASAIGAILAFHKGITSLTDARIQAGTSSELRAQIEVNNLAQEPTVAPNPTNSPLELDF